MSLPEEEEEEPPQKTAAVGQDQRIAALEATILGLEAGIAERDQKLLTLRGANARLDRDLTQVKYELDTLRATKDAVIKERLDTLRRELDAESQANLDALRAEKDAELQAALEALRKEKDAELGAKLDALRAELAKVRAEKDAERQAALEALRKEKDAELGAKLAELRPEIAKLRAQVEKPPPPVTKPPETRRSLVPSSASSGSIWAAKQQARATVKETKFLETVPGNVGIIDHLTKRYGNNVHVANRVTIAASSCMDEWKYPPKNIADRNELAFCSNDEPDQWISYDFRLKKIKPTHYCISATPNVNGCAQHFNLMSWVIEGSSDGTEWLTLDAKDGNNDLHAGRATKTWPCVCPNQIQMIRLRQTGKNQHGTDNLTISFFEIFGSLFE